MLYSPPPTFAFEKTFIRDAQPLRFGNESKASGEKTTQVQAPAPAKSPIADELILLEVAEKRDEDRKKLEKETESKPEPQKKAEPSRLRRMYDKWKNRPKEPVGKKIRRYILETLVFYGVIGGGLWVTGIVESKYEKGDPQQCLVRVTHTVHLPNFLKPLLGLKPDTTETAPDEKTKPDVPK